LLSYFFYLYIFLLSILDLLTALCFNGGALNLLLLSISFTFCFKPFLLLLSRSILYYMYYLSLLFLLLSFCALDSLLKTSIGLNLLFLLLSLFLLLKTLTYSLNFSRTVKKYLTREILLLYKFFSLLYFLRFFSSLTALRNPLFL
jgi:hypothetical protein